MSRRVLSSLIASCSLLVVASSVVADASPAAAMSRPRDASQLVTLYVSPSGSDQATGRTTKSPLATLQAALNLATPGTTIRLAPGVYTKGATTRTDGTASAPIRIYGPRVTVDPRSPSSAPAAVVYGNGGHVLDIRNSYYTVAGFGIDGQSALESAVAVPSWPSPSSTVDQVDDFKAAHQDAIVDDRLVYIADDDQPVHDVRLQNMTLTGAGGECVHVRENSSKVVITQTVISWCGLYGKTHGRAFTFHNGEGVYIGTSPKSTDLSDHANDTTSNVTVMNSEIRTFGSECFEVKENAHNNTLRSTTCEWNTEPSGDYGSNVELRGYRNTVRDSAISVSAGFGVKITSDSSQTDMGGNSVMNNSINNDASGAVYVKSGAAQGRICGNSSRSVVAHMPDTWTVHC